MKKYVALPVVALWVLLTAAAWFGPAKEISDAERRPLAQMPAVSGNTVTSGKFMKDFESYSLDQFPLRDGFRTVKSLFHFYALGQKDNNEIYLADGYAAKQEYPLNPESLNHAADRFDYLREKYLADSRVFLAVVPDKGYYLAEESGHLTMDYEAMTSFFREELPWAEQINLTDVLSVEDYYRTDTHWRQERLIPAAQRICEALGVSGPDEADYTQTAMERPFYGVYYGQAALPMAAETLYVLENELLSQCSVYDHETGKTGAVYDRTKLDSKDLYDVFLSGSRSLLTIENPAGKEGKELIVFRDSFGSSIIPLLAKDYQRVTVVDIRYIQIDVLEKFIEFHGQDVLLLYSTLVLNNSETIK